MMEYTFESVRGRGQLLYEFIRGSRSYGLDLPDSDTDLGGVFIMDFDDLTGFPSNYLSEIKDENQDQKWYEVGAFVEFLCNSNPTMLESLFVDDEYVLYMHPAFKYLRDHRDMFVTKKAFPAFTEYARKQIYKARGKNKKIVNPITVRLRPIDFCHCLDGRQGTMPTEEWLDMNGLKQEFCGLTHLKGLRETFGLYYDFGAHLKALYPTSKDFQDWANMDGCKLNRFVDVAKKAGFILPDYYHMMNDDFYNDFVKHVAVYGYKGIHNMADTSNEMRTLDSVPKEAVMINIMGYNMSAYGKHCREYREYQDWDKKKNPKRFIKDQEKGYNAKNLSHCMRLMNMGIEIARYGEVRVNRRGIDRDFLLSIKRGEAPYDDIIKMADEKVIELDEAIKGSTLPDDVDRDKAEMMLLAIRNEFYK